MLSGNIRRENSKSNLTFSQLLQYISKSWHIFIVQVSIILFHIKAGRSYGPTGWSCHSQRGSLVLNFTNPCYLFLWFEGVTQSIAKMSKDFFHKYRISYLSIEYITYFGISHLSNSQPPKYLKTPASSLWHKLSDYKSANRNVIFMHVLHFSWYIILSFARTVIINSIIGSSRKNNLFLYLFLHTENISSRYSNMNVRRTDL